MISIGDRIPEATLVVSGNSSDPTACAIPKQITSTDLLKGKIILFAVPGAFTPTCHLNHLPGYIQHATEFKQKGINSIFCLSTNDIFVLDAWAKSMNANDIQMVSDGNGEFVTKLGLSKDMSSRIMGSNRTERFAMVCENGVITHIAVGDLSVSGADIILTKV
ncbi:Redoxin [Globomyces pollinis-pini]|nr:Redoxin [Globomyces pollinis-pini]